LAFTAGADRGEEPDDQPNTCGEEAQDQVEDVVRSAKGMRGGLIAVGAVVRFGFRHLFCGYY